MSALAAMLIGLTGAMAPPVVISSAALANSEGQQCVWNGWDYDCY
jgi:hypothetical protein